MYYHSSFINWQLASQKPLKEEPFDGNKSRNEFILKYHTFCKRYRSVRGDVFFYLTKKKKRQIIRLLVTLGSEKVFNVFYVFFSYIYYHYFSF